MKLPLAILLFPLLLSSAPRPAFAADIRVAVASNFRDAVTAITDRFEQESGNEVILSFGSTGKHYAQIVNGAPFDLFLAADAERPRRLERSGHALPGSRFSYALGRLVLWSPDEQRAGLDGESLQRDDFHHLAIANPELAPYGLAARQALQALGAWDRVSDRLVIGENIGQAWQYVVSGNAELGLVALSQIRSGKAPGGAWWLVPESLHQPIEQQAVQLRNRPAAAELLAFLRSPVARGIIRQYGYGLPDDR